MRILKFLLLAVIMSGLAFAAGCDDSSSSGSDTGTLSVYLTDAAVDDFKEVWVTIEEVAVHMAENDNADEQSDNPGNEENGNKSDDNGNWKIVASPEKTYNLLELVNGAMAELGTTELESGHYTQIRLMLGENPDGEAHPHANYLVSKNDTVTELTIPSGYQTGIKLVHGFDMVTGQTAELVLDFDASRSIVATGSGKCLLKPTIKIVDTLNNPLVQGVVRDASGNRMPDAVVSAQAVGPQGTTEVFATTLTEDEAGKTGAYQMYLPVGTYFIVAYKAGISGASAYGPACRTVEAAQLDAVYGGNDFSLEMVNTGEILINVVLPAAVGETVQTAALSVRQTASCGDGNKMIEVTSKTVSESGEYRFNIPGNQTGIDYTIVASSDGNTLKETVTVSEGLTSPAVEFDFTSL